MGLTNSKHEHEYKYLGMTRKDIVLDVLLCRCTLLMHPGVSSMLIHKHPTPSQPQQFIPS